MPTPCGKWELRNRVSRIGGGTAKKEPGHFASRRVIDQSSRPGGKMKDK